MSVVRAVVLARGAGTRMRAAAPDAQLTPAQRKAADAGLKPLMPMAGRPFLDYVLGSLAHAGLPDICIVVGPSPNAVREHYDAAPRPTRLRIDFVIQEEPRGTADAVLAAEEWTGGQPFLIVNADNLYPVDAMRALAALDQPGLLAFERDDLVASSNIPAERVQSFAILDVEDDGLLRRIVEKPAADQMPASGGPVLVSMNCWRFDARIFSACRDVAPSPRGELELPDAVMLAMARGVRFRALPAQGPVIDLSRRSDTAEVERRLRDVRVTL
jgi:glucose-1-phosphate thymidylyltransferase